MILIYFVIFYSVSINENDYERYTRYPGYPKVPTYRNSGENFVNFTLSTIEIARAKYIGLRNQGRTKLYSIRVKFKLRFNTNVIFDDLPDEIGAAMFYIFGFGEAAFSISWNNLLSRVMKTTENSHSNSSLLLLQGVHPNPGPRDSTGSESIKLITYNCRGLRNTNKLRRLLEKTSKLVNKGAIVALQETHKIDEKIMKDIWTHKFILNCSSTDQKGIAILFNKKYEIVDQYLDNDDRIAIVNIKSESQQFIVANVYCPNDHRESVIKIEDLYQNLLKFKFDSPEGVVLLMGDLNVCMTDKDSLNRTSLRQEQIVVSNITENNKMMKLKDSFRHCKDEAGFTWNRGKCFSRLDHVFVSESILRYIKEVSTDWAFDKSDHAAVIIDVKLPTTSQLGPGIVRVNTSVLENHKLLEQIRINLKEYLDQAPISWNPNLKLEFLKVGIRTTFAEAARQYNIDSKCEHEMVEGELNHLVNLKIKMASVQNVNKEEQTRKLENIELAISQIQAKQTILATKYSQDLAKKAKIKWYELGERSNKYFLGLLKLRQCQKYIGEITCEGIKFVGQKAVELGIMNFYSGLYSKVPSNFRWDNFENEDDFYKYCPKLTDEQREYVDRPLSLEEISNALKSCKDSSPGPDGIPYSVYRALWDIAAPILMESWTYSLDKGLLPQSHLDSIITLLPKEGKDTRDIKNWRPITLANCDAKIITKALANRVSLVLETIIDKSQTAYIPGRSVMDNIRSNFLIRSYCKKKNIEALLISLDAKKAFDSVSHEYICRTLKEYGFGNYFISTFKTLYNNLTSEIMVNGFKTGKINIRRGVKQGDALSCALFIISIDPLLRNVDNNTKIKGIKITTDLRGSRTYKINGYADDIAVTTLDDQDSLDQIFKEYERLSLRSGLELNADKTEIIRLHTVGVHPPYVRIKYLSNDYRIDLVEKLKICGVFYSNDKVEEYKLNILDKIDKLKNQLRKWMVRHLTLEGKVLIVKTFGLSQLIYNLQCYEINSDDLVKIERLIFKFMWSKTWDENKKCTERIKRSILKNDFEHGGIKAPDVESLNRALKLKQFLRSCNADHHISHLQKAILKDLGYNRPINQEYSRIFNEESVIKVGQETINILTDFSRQNSYGGLDKALTMKNAIDMASSICIYEYLERKKFKLLQCLYNPIRKQSILTLGELLFEKEVGQLSNYSSVIENIINTISKDIIQIAFNHNENVNDFDSTKVFFLDGSQELREASLFSVKDFQAILKKATNKVESLDVSKKNNLVNFSFDNCQITRFRKQCKNTKLRSIFHRLINKDFFHGLKLQKFKIRNSPNCERCHMIEDNNHLLFSCEYSRRMWNTFNTVIQETCPSSKKVERFEDIYDFSGSKLENLTKIKLIQATIQIIRPTVWTEDRIRNIVREQKLLNYIK